MYTEHKENGKNNSIEKNGFRNNSNKKHTDGKLPHVNLHCQFPKNFKLNPL